MLGAVGALCCLAGGTASGSWMRLRRMERLHMLQAEVDALNTMRLMLETERPALPELLECCAEHVRGGEGAQLFEKRLRLTAHQLRCEPLESTGDSYAFACAQTVTCWEQEE